MCNDTAQQAQTALLERNEGGGGGRTWVLGVIDGRSGTAMAMATTITIILLLPQTIYNYHSRMVCLTIFAPILIKSTFLILGGSSAMLDLVGTLAYHAEVLFQASL